MPLSTGTRLGPYEIAAPLGAGGMGEVYSARDTRLNRTVAIKVLPEHIAGDPEAKRRFEREAQTVAGLNHPNICVLHDIGHDAGLDFLVMEHLDGVTLQDRLAKGPLSLAEATKIGMEVADALDRRATQLDQVTLVEDLADQPHAGQVVQALPVRRADAGALLAAMLEGVHGEERQSGRLGGLGHDGDDATGFTWLHGRDRKSVV